MKPPAPSLCPGPDYLPEKKEGPRGPLKSRTALPGCQLVPMGVGQQLDRVERKSWRYPQPWWPPSEKDETGLGHPRHPGGFLPLGIHWGESLAWPVRALVYSAILEMESSFLFSWGLKGLGIGLSQLLALFPFLKQPSSASSSSSSPGFSP